MNTILLQVLEFQLFPRFHKNRQKISSGAAPGSRSLGDSPTSVSGHLPLGTSPLFSEFMQKCIYSGDGFIAKLSQVFFFNAGSGQY